MGSLLGLFFSGFVSATLLPGSSEAILVGLLAAAQENPYMLVLAATAGNVLGSVFNWICGSYLISFQNRRWFPVSPKQIDKAQKWFARFGVWSLLFAWLPVIGDPLTVIAGILRVSFPSFLILVTIGKLARYGVIAALALAWI